MIESGYVRMNYREQLRDPRWQKRRLELFQQRNWMCEDCDKTTETLSVHHFYYIRDLYAWEYPDDALRVVCLSCHEYRQEIEDKIKNALSIVLAKLPPKRLQEFAQRVFDEAMLDIGL